MRCLYGYRGCPNHVATLGLCQHCGTRFLTRHGYAQRGIPRRPPPIRYPASGNYRPDNIHWSIWVDRRLACKARVDGNP